MDLMTKELAAKFPPLYANDGKAPGDVPIVAKFFDPTGSATWYATEYDGRDTFFGWAEVLPGCGEYGYFSLAELSSVRGRLGVGIERDLYFEGKTLADVIG